MSIFFKPKDDNGNVVLNEFIIDAVKAVGNKIDSGFSTLGRKLTGWSASEIDHIVEAVKNMKTEQDKRATLERIERALYSARKAWKEVVEKERKVRIDSHEPHIKYDKRGDMNDLTQDDRKAIDKTTKDKIRDNIDHTVESKQISLHIQTLKELRKKVLEFKTLDYHEEKPEDKKEAIDYEKHIQIKTLNNFLPDR